MHVPVAVRIALQDLLGAVIDDVVAHHGIEPYGKHFLVAVLPEGVKRAVLDGDFLHHVDLAEADVFVNLLLVLVEEILALERADGLPVAGSPGLLYLHENLTGEADELLR